MTTLSNSLSDTWRPDPKIAKWASQHGFGSAIAMTDQDLRELSRGHQGKPTGLYIWEGIEHEIYIGISNASVTTRLRQHAKDYGFANIQCFRYRASDGDRSELRELERDLIYEALAHDFRVFNREHSAIIFGKSVFDDKIEVDRQQRWFKNPVRTNASAPKESREVSAAAISKSTKNFEKFSHLDEASDVVNALSLYLKACVPFPFATESEYWSVTCLPSWSKSRLITLNMGYLEMFYVNRNARKNRIEIYVGSDYQLLPRWRSWIEIRRLGVRRRGPIHPAGLPNEEVLKFKSIEGFIAAITSSPEIRLAIARFALDRMRKGRVSGRYRDAHNVLLAGKALDRMNYWTPKRFKA